MRIEVILGIISGYLLGYALTRMSKASQELREFKRLMKMKNKKKEK